MMAGALLVLAVAIQGTAQPPQVCPWLNAGTAAKALGADVTVTAHSDSNWSGSCRFVSSTAPAASIEVMVGKVDAHPCVPGATPLAGIGNQAVLCSAKNASGSETQTISGRVRDAWFVVALVTSPDKSHISAAQNESPDSSPIEFLAEQVTGNLY